MTTPTESNENSPIIESKAALVAHLADGCKPHSDWRIGTEHEKFPFLSADFGPVPYAGDASIAALLEGLQAAYGWEPILEGDAIIGLKKDGASVSLEPGGQFELSGAPLDNIHQTCREVDTHIIEAKAIGDQIGVSFLGSGASPVWRLEDTPMMPKGRYQIMANYMPKVGRLGKQMMFRTATVQANYDFGSEADMVMKMRVALALQPLGTALFANSPFLDGRPNGFMSYRSQIWTDTDPDRSGMLPFVFDEGFGFEQYVDYALDVPMYFLRRGDYLDATGVKFNAFLDRKAFAEHTPKLSDFEDHLTTIFPEVRLKTFMEMRGSDSGSHALICAFSAFWTGILYDSNALNAAWDLVKTWSNADRVAMRHAVPKLALQTPLPNGAGNLLDLAKRVMPLARAGLNARNRLNASGGNETGFLDPLEQIISSGKSPARQLLEDYHTRWNGDISQIFRDHAY